MGSHVYRDSPDYLRYPTPGNQISGWAYNAARDTEYDPATPPTWGKPYCKQWWEDGAIETLDALAAQYSDNEAADWLRSAQKQLFFQSTNCNELKLKGNGAQIYSPYFSTQRQIWRAQCFFLRLNNYFLKRLSFRLISKLENSRGRL